MEKLKIDLGVKEYEINGRGVLRFSPTDPGLYSRLANFTEQLEEKQKELKMLDDLTDGEMDLERAKELARRMDETDRFLKDRLSYVFGEENDFDQLFGGVSTLATASNGEWVITNFLNALKPELQAGAESYWKNKKQAAVEQANRNRAQRRAGK